MCLAAALAEARQEIARLSAELADARGWLREHAKWACGHISEGTGGEPEVCRICAVQDSEAEARRALVETEGKLLYCPPRKCLPCVAGLACEGAPTCDSRERNHAEALAIVRAALAAEPDGEPR